MKFIATPLAGAMLIDLEPIEDERGWFARTYSHDEFAAHGLDPNVVQCSHSFTQRRGTLRGLHYQAAPFAESKLVRCVVGDVFDVIVDLRESSATYRQWFGTTLSARMRNALYVPAGFAHGWLSLSDGVEMLYQMSARHESALARGVRWDDPALAIEWPSRPLVISERDATFPLLGGPS